MSAGAIRYGISFSAGGAAPPAVTPATPTPTSFRKSRRGMPTGSDMGPLVVAHQTVHGRWKVRVVEVLAVAADAPAHLERAVLVDAVHRLHRAVALLAGDTRAHVALVVELHVVGEVVDLDPRHLLAPVEVPGELLDLGLVGGHDLVAAHAGADGRDVRPLRVGGAVVAIFTVQIGRARVDLVAEVDGLNRTLGRAEPHVERLRQRHAGRDEADENEGTRDEFGHDRGENGRASW